MKPRDPVLASSRREALWVVAIWSGSALYTVGYAACCAYGQGPPRLLFGMPHWVVWGILAPWFVCLALTTWLAFWGMTDEDLGREEGDG